MRIVGGELRGRRLTAPAGRAVRPTSDRARQALFNILEHRPDVTLAGGRAADLFAGSGALGLEALSRGAAEALFIDTAPAALAAIRANLAALGLEDRAEVRRMDATRLGPPPGGAFDLVFLDPPYGAKLLAEALAALEAKDWLAGGATAVAECAAGAPAPDLPDVFERLDERVYGAARLLILRRISGT